VVCAETDFSEHMHSVLPTFPYFYILVSQSARFVNCSDTRHLTPGTFQATL
jgi:hypothetical protein